MRVRKKQQQRFHSVDELLLQIFWDALGSFSSCSHLQLFVWLGMYGKCVCVLLSETVCVLQLRRALFCESGLEYFLRSHLGVRNLGGEAVNTESVDDSLEELLPPPPSS